MVKWYTTPRKQSETMHWVLIYIYFLPSDSINLLIGLYPKDITWNTEGKKSFPHKDVHHSIMIKVRKKNANNRKIK